MKGPQFIAGEGLFQCIVARSPHAQALKGIVRKRLLPRLGPLSKAHGAKNTAAPSFLVPAMIPANLTISR